MTARPPTPDPDPRAAPYLDALRAAPTPRHVAELRARGIPVPATQREASAALTVAIRREAVRR